MGNISNHALLVTSIDREAINKAYGMVGAIFLECFNFLEYELKGLNLLSPIIEGVVNSQYTFFVAPDGSKNGWEDSEIGAKARKRAIEAISKISLVEYIEVRFACDDEPDAIVSTSTYTE